ncbi:MAG: PD-(D/E)XK nuclease family protein, partial [Muribaculaceae bacterium]|nr:PD-(D/E)XK nuclease family protein [Muribaculaceae bacterium]
MESFLERIAVTYLREEHDRMVDYCFVFPNKRSGTFFKYTLEHKTGSTLLLPHITTITELVYDLTDGVEASRMEQLFLLYNIYKGISREIGDFDKFQFWGEMLLNDFNDVDRYMVDASQLFSNVQRLKEIGANYLTDEQIEIIRRFWGEERSDDSIERFWTHVPG